MKRLDQAGFTLIEIILFLALSSTFLIIAFTGISGRNQQVQFNDAIRSLHSSLQNEYTQLVNGVNLATAPPSGCTNDTTGACILMGKVIEFSGGVVTTDLLYGDYLDLEDYDEGDVDLLDEARPRSASVIGTQDIKWGVEFTDTAGNYSPDINPIDRIGLLRSPASARIIPIVYRKGVDVDSINNYQPASTDTALDDEVNAFICFRGTNGQVAAITFGSEEGNAKIGVEFDRIECI